MIKKSILAGVYIGLASYASTLTDVLILKALIFPIGIIAVIGTGSKLFTAQMLEEPSLKWAEVWLLNLVGVLIVFIIAPTSINIDPKLTLPFFELFTRAMLCNMLVCTGVYLAKKYNKPAYAYPFIFMFVFCGFEHSIADMFFLIAGCACILDWVRIMLIVTAGNIVGGLLIKYLVSAE